MTSEVEERPRLVTASYGRHRSQWVKVVVKVLELVGADFPSFSMETALQELPKDNKLEISSF